MYENDLRYYDNLEAEKARIRRIEDSVRRKPTQSDYKETVKLLKDFDIKIAITDIPANLRSVCELERWRRDLIKKLL
jgi:hypothetical protein